MHLFYEVRHGKATYTCIFRSSLAIRVVAQGARPDSGLAAVRDNFGHDRVIRWKPIRGAERILYLGDGEFQLGAWQLPERLIGRRSGRG